MLPSAYLGRRYSFCSEINLSVNDINKHPVGIDNPSWFGLWHQHIITTAILRLNVFRSFVHIWSALIYSLPKSWYIKSDNSKIQNMKNQHIHFVINNNSWIHKVGSVVIRAQIQLLFTLHINEFPWKKR